MKRPYIFLAALVLAIVPAVVQNGGQAFTNLRFHLGMSDEREIHDAIAVSITQYNKNSAGFYATAGESLEGLAVIPASQLQKRRLFQDINMLKRDGLVMVFDLDSQKIRESRLVNRTTAVAQTSEVWAIALQDVMSRAPLSGVKAVAVTVRYLLHYEPGPTGKPAWIVYESDVYPEGESVPDLNIRRVL